MVPSPSAAARVRPATPAPAHQTSHAPARFAPGGTTRAAIVALAALLAVAPSATAQSGDAVPDSTALVTRLGKDTLAVEHVVRAGNVIEADVLLRTPSTTRTRYRMELDADGAPRSWTSTVVDVRTGAPTGAGEVVTRSGDSLRIETTGPSGARTRVVAADAATLPFIDMVHWPFEPALQRLRASGRDSIVQPLLTGARTSDFRLGATGGDSATITHPFRGTMRVRADDGGKLIVNRQTGQNGNSYDAAQDLGRVAASFRPLTQSVELFTIVADETQDGGLLRLQWANGEMAVPFRVR